MKKYFCCECGHPVAAGADGQPGRCARHPEAKRYSESWLQKQFAAMRAAAATNGPGRVYHSGGYWGELDRRAAAGAKGIL